MPPVFYEKLKSSVSKGKKAARKFFRDLFLTEEELDALKKSDEAEEEAEEEESLAEQIAQEEDEDEEEQPIPEAANPSKASAAKEQQLPPGTSSLAKEILGSEAEVAEEEEEEVEGVIPGEVNEAELAAKAALEATISQLESEIASKKTALEKSKELLKQLSEQVPILEKKEIELKEKQIGLKESDQLDSEQLRRVNEAIALNEDKMKLNEKKTKLTEKEITVAEQELEALEEQLEGLITESKKQQPVGSDEEETVDSTIPPAIWEKIIKRLPSQTRRAINNWGNEWSEYTKKDLIKLLVQLDQRHSVLLEDKYIGKLNVEKLVMLMHQSQSLEESGTPPALTRTEFEAHMLKQGDESVSLWTSRAGNVVDEKFDDELYGKLTKTFDTNEPFFEEGASSAQDNLNKIAKVAGLVSGFKLVGPNPMAQFKKDIQQLVSNAGAHLAGARKMAVDLRSKINAALSDSTLDAVENCELKKYYNVWIRHLERDNIEELEESDIDAILMDEKCNYLVSIENVVRTMLDELWKSEHNAKKSKVTLNPKNQVIIKYFSEFIEKAEETIQPMRVTKSERMDKEEFEEIELQNSRSDYNNEDYADLSESPGRANKKEKNRGSDQAALTSQWQDLRFQGRMCVIALVWFYNDKISEQSESKEKFIKLRDEFVRKRNGMISEVLNELSKKFSVHSTIQESGVRELKAIKLAFTKNRNRISQLMGGADKLDAKIRKIKEEEPTLINDELPQEDYTLPDFNE